MSFDIVVYPGRLLWRVPQETGGLRPEKRRQTTHVGHESGRGTSLWLGAECFAAAATVLLLFDASFHRPGASIACLGASPVANSYLD